MVLSVLALPFHPLLSILLSSIIFPPLAYVYSLIINVNALCLMFVSFCFRLIVYLYRQ